MPPTPTPGILLPFRTGSSAKMYIRHLEALCDVYSPEGHPFAVARRPADDDDEDDEDEDFVFIKNGVWCNVTTDDEDDEYENFQVNTDSDETHTCFILLVRLATQHDTVHHT